MCRTNRLAPAALLLAVVAFGFVPPARGGIDGSPHDLISQRYIPVKPGAPRDRCMWCHIPIAGRSEVINDTPPPSVEYYSRTGLVCYSCHDGTSIVSQDTDASAGAFSPLSHPLLLGGWERPTSKSNVELPGIRQTSMECVTCHNVHDDGSRPFLWTEYPKLCEICHQGLLNEGYGKKNVSANHPVHESIVDDAGKKTPIQVDAVFKVPFPPAYPAAAGRQAVGVHWLRGGHLLGGTAGTVECFTCHAVHGTETLPPEEGLLAKPALKMVADEFCEGCHRGQRGDGNKKSPYFPNPGGTITGRTYHPCDDDESAGRATNLNIRMPRNWPLGKGTKQTILCTTCHVAHRGLTETPLLRKPEESPTFCEECHLAVLLPFHHPNGPDANPEKLCKIPDDAHNIGVRVEGALYCSTCHVGHNAGLAAMVTDFKAEISPNVQEKMELDYIPILRDSMKSDALCFLCHPQDNVTCREKNKGKASHFLGDPTLTETYGDKNPPLRINPWPDTKLFSRYGGDNGKSVVCLSCHVFSGSDASGQEKPLPHYLLSYAGADYEWGDELGVYLCTGCHGENPSGAGAGGHSHPYLSAESSHLGREPQLPATATVNEHLNCDSCHNSHGAIPATGYYILEAGTGYGHAKSFHPIIDFTLLCQLCHPK